MNQTSLYWKRSLQVLFGVVLAVIIGLVSGRFWAASAFEVRLLHTNDHHAHLEPVEMGENETLGGISKRKTLIDRLREESDRANQPLLLLDAGDVFQGTLYFNTYQGQADGKFYNALNYDAMTLGNHEFDQGQEVLRNFIEESKFSIVSANLDIESSSPLSGWVKPWIILKKKGQNIGILGLTTPETMTMAEVGEGVEFLDPVQAAQQAVNELTQEGVNKIIALTHLGITEDLELARQVDGIDVIIGGHSHTRVGDMPEAVYPYPIVEKTPNGQPVLVVTDWEWGKYLGDLNVRFDRQGHLQNWEGNLHPVSDEISANPQFQAILKTFSQPIQKLKSKVIGETPIKLNGDRPYIRREQTNLGTLLGEALLVKTARNQTEIAITNGGGIRGSIAAGEITIGDILEAFPFPNTVIEVDLTGKQIKELLEYGVSQVDKLDGCFPQVAGMRLDWQADLPVGSRMLRVDTRQGDGSYLPLDLERNYRVVTSSFLFKGGDGYTLLSEGKNVVDTGYLISDTLIEYIRDRDSDGSHYRAAEG
ncbi:bifunctional UDP-sugar hydrolase/5'-nucleotidase [Roseofilum sp. BLCC_M91]|uniref:Bifunctional UDP-sugar hydrolase/5'-nucleotidase n=1 Tax=Roseofilum halophilum BLCC-M91 TaxID=3022259 RepID=A0ABT7BMP2_9CYAN|nr:bifunctional UDP-sugar hydrolase/5'-nucleotidase [Roseofilum halophilum]MDJ1180464.1 bifunctional UDP-sugar hydrolase/5'-nucleotidase [Roseofilum halophilum BLCC-M91]